MRLILALLAAAVLVTMPVLALDRLLALAGTGMATRDAAVVLVALVGATAAALFCPRSRGARLVLAGAALAIALEPVGDGLVLPVAAAGLSLLAVWLVRPAPVAAARR